MSGLRSGLALAETYAMKAYPFPSLPKSPAGRLAFLHDLAAGFEVYDENGEPTGERTDPCITLEDFARLAVAVDP
jgi:hypothetical protein